MRIYPHRYGHRLLAVAVSRTGVRRPSGDHREPGHQRREFFASAFPERLLGTSIVRRK